MGKNINVMVGQVWECKNNAGNYTKGKRILLDSFNGVFELSAVNFSHAFDSMLCSEGFITDHFEFVPQTDLEWLAVNVDEWSGIFSGIYFIRKYKDMALYFNGTNSTNCKCYTKQQLQDKQIELGLLGQPNDDIITNVLTDSLFNSSLKAYLKSIKEQVSVGFNCRCQTVNIKPKEDSKLKLTKGDVGEKFVLNDGSIAIGVACSNTQFVSQDDDGSGCFNVHRLDGATAEHNSSGGLCSDSSIKKRHEPRWWLDQLPDADLFHDRVNYIHCEGGVWAYHSNLWACCHEIKLIKMPEINGSDYNLSKITIEDLRKYQLSKKG